MTVSGVSPTAGFWYPGLWTWAQLVFMFTTSVEGELLGQKYLKIIMSVFCFSE